VEDVDVVVVVVVVVDVDVQDCRLKPEPTTFPGRLLLRGE